MGKSTIAFVRFLCSNKAEWGNISMVVLEALDAIWFRVEGRSWIEMWIDAALGASSFLGRGTPEPSVSSGGDRRKVELGLVHCRKVVESHFGHS